MDIEKAMMDDPTVYEYDEIYDDLQASKPKVGRDRSEKDRQDKKVCREGIWKVFVFCTVYCLKFSLFGK